MNQQKVGKFIASVRKELNLTQAQLGEKLGVTGKTVSKWETGIYMPDLSLLKRLSEILGVSIYELLDGERIPVNIPEKSKSDVLIESLKAYVSSVKKSMLKKGAIIIISTVISFVAIIGFMLVKNNYDNCYIYSITSKNEQYEIKGILTSTPEKSIISINSIKNLMNFDLDIEMAYAYEYTLKLNDSVLSQRGSISTYEHTPDAKLKYLNDLLLDTRIYIEENKNFNEILKFDNYDSIILKLSYLNQNLEAKHLEIPFDLVKIFSNDKISYDGGSNF